MVVTRTERERFDTNPALFLEKTIKEYVADSLNNRFRAFDGEPVWDEPLVGFADGDDAIFHSYKTIIGDFHLTPREALESRVKEAGCGGEKRLSSISVISWILPSTRKTRISLRRETVAPSLRWNHTRWQGQDFIFRLSRHLVSVLEGFGCQAVAPELEKYWETFPVSGQAGVLIVPMTGRYAVLP